ncbi:Oidioi.mRNA.OKI2018_I69.chr1.g147.t1.cds [Oikopleura dioica]|uniref:Oidioi.mRNA.OKI2018_I69.chr1.g147.t1.cds n=1 Tax=Oikopleura dioica TaxID=34765 RepID=A0ABN7SNG3_OIKDI|nr:Oidioi.mRNA.OKI2018_I69.chr1.g147.t1.cds [Oikopleura dioica]
MADGSIKLKDPYGFHTCCNFDHVNCGTPKKFFSYDKSRGACKPVFLRRLCPDLLDDLLAVKDHLNLFSRRDDCRSICTPELISTTDVPASHEALEPEESTNDMEAANNENSFGGFEILEWRGVNRMGPSGGINPNNHFSPFASIYSIMQPYFVGDRPSFGGSNEMEMMQFDAVPVGTLEQENPCHLPMDKGYAQILRKTAMWYFNSKSGDCESFLWRGAGGNNNRFVTYQMCAKVCMKNDDEDNALVPSSARRLNLAPKMMDICDQSPPKSSCGFANMATRFYFDKSDGKCHIYLSTECQFCKLGNCNSFATKDECKTACMKKRP